MTGCFCIGSLYHAGFLQGGTFRTDLSGLDPQGLAEAGGKQKGRKAETAEPKAEKTSRHDGGWRNEYGLIQTWE